MEFDEIFKIDEKCFLLAEKEHPIAFFFCRGGGGVGGVEILALLCSYDSIQTLLILPQF